MSRPDVVTRLVDHQQNLRLPPAPRSQVLLALPTPPLCDALGLLDLFFERRECALRELAEEIGGGDGPLRVVDLDRDGRRLPDVLEDLAAEGVERLHLHGAHDAPGFARAIAFRWGGAISPAARASDPRHSVLYPLMDDTAPVVWLSREVVRLRGGAEALAAARIVLVGLAADEDPEELADGEVDRRPYALDPERRVAPWSGLVPAAGLFGTARGERLRQCWQARWERSGGSEDLRCACLGLDPRLEERLRGDVPERTRPRARVFVVTGIDGAGKSTHAARLREGLETAGYRASVLKIFRQGAFLELANEMGARTRRGAPLAAFRVSRIVKLVDSLRALRDAVEPAARECDALVMDRYLETHEAAAGSQLGWDLGSHPVLAAFPATARCFWLQLPFQEALARLGQRGERLSADEHPVGLLGYQRIFEKLASGPEHVVLDAQMSLEDNAARLLQLALAELPAPAAPAPLRDYPVSTRAPQERRGRCALAIGGRQEEALGEDVFSLRALLGERLGRAAGGVPEAFWVEAYAAQIAVDLRSARPASARVALWPGALARMEVFRDLAWLAEAERLIAPEVVVTSAGVGSLEEPLRAFEALGAAPSAARRMASRYALQLAEIAAEAGWDAGTS